MTRFYTGTGDAGYSIMLGKKVYKGSEIIEAIGAIDELNSFIGLALLSIDDDKVAKQLEAAQENLFIAGAELAACINSRFAPKRKLGRPAVRALEEAIEDLASRLPGLKNFVLPRGSEASSYLHVARAIARRTERCVVKIIPKYKNSINTLPYLNRLSSYLFVAALYMNKKEGVEEANPHY
ncbi:MAG: cob(I)yrinic acid a,c-diamide adenosyltransferase [Candidatus Micrarchaeia archaeon]